MRVVVLTYGTSGVHQPLLASLAAEGVDPEEILVVHNPSRRDEPAPAVPPGVETVLAPHNLGYAAGMNLGLRRVLEDPDCEFVLVLTHDARLRPGALARLLAAARSRPRFGVLGPVLVFTGTETPFSYGGVRRADGRLEHRRSEPTAGGDRIAPCDWVDGGTMLVRTQALRAVGVFDERFWGYVEEAELCLRVERAGYQVGVVLDACADQDPGGPKRPGPWAYLLTRNGIAYAQRALGNRAAARLLAAAAWRVGFELARAASRKLGLRPGPASEPGAVAIGVARGAVDFLRGRWGPPPSDLPGAGDVGNLGG